MDLLKKIAIARSNIIINDPFFASLALHLQIKLDDKVPTAYTNGRVLGISPNFIEEISQLELQGVIKHEVLHALLGHCNPWRRGARNQAKWNIAADYVINPMIIAGGDKLPEGLLLDQQYENNSVEQVYAKLPSLNDLAKQFGGSSDPGGCGECRDYESETNDEDGNPQPISREEAEAQETEWKQRAAQAAQAAKAAGKLSESMKRFVDDILFPTISWEQQLLDFVEMSARNNYTLRPPGRRHISRGFYLHSLKSPELGHIIYGVDTSGSMNQRALEAAGGELSGILQSYECELDVVYCDSEIPADGGIQKLGTYDLPINHKYMPCGGGGTSFRPVFEYAEQNDPVALLYFTDLYPCDGYPEEPPFPVLWIVPEEDWDEDNLPPFGRVLVVRTNDQ